MSTNHRLVALQFTALLGFWLLLSWRSDPLFLSLGVLFAAALTAATRSLTETILHGGRPSPPLRRVPVLMVRFVFYLVWLLSRIVLASLQLIWYVLHPKLPLDPVELRFTTSLESPLARTFLTNSITLVPGTLTVDIEDREITVHALFPHAADDVVNAKLQNRIAGLFDEPPQPRVHPQWLDEPVPEPGAPDPTDSTWASEHPEPGTGHGETRR